VRHGNPASADPFVLFVESGVEVTGPGTDLGQRILPGSAVLEEHWSYMDGFAESMTARGPTLDTDRETANGSLHVLALPSVDAGREFVAAEPNNRAGVYREHLLWRFENLLDRSMWEFPSRAAEPLPDHRPFASCTARFSGVPPDRAARAVDSERSAHHARRC
jgi:hypothetical protein